MKGETMVSDQEIARGVEILLRQSHSDPQQNAAVSSLNGVVQHLGAKFGLDLSHKAAFIRDQINLLRHYQSAAPPPQPPPQPAAALPRDHFALQNHPQFLAAHLHQQRQHLQQQQQQQQQFPPQFGLNFAAFRGHAPLQNPHAPPQQHHALPPPPVQSQQVVSPPPAPAKNASRKGSKESTPGAKRRGGAGGLNKLCGVSPELQVVVGEAAMARTEIVKQLWAYIRKNNLQDPSNKRKIICDEALRAVFEIDCTDMFKMNKLLAKHILPYDPAKHSAPSKRQKVDVESTAEAAEATEAASPVIISDALALFLGTTKREMLLSEATQRVVEYIKVNSLEDPSSMTVICDEKLRELFGCENIPVHGISDMLARHHLFQS